MWGFLGGSMVNNPPANASVRGDVGCHSLFQGIFPEPGIKPTSPLTLALAGGLFTIEPPRKPHIHYNALQES